MPKVLRAVEQDVSIEEANGDLRAATQRAAQDGVKLPDGTVVEDGDFLVPTNGTYKDVPIMPDTYVYVGKVLKEAAIFWGMFHNKDGSKTLAFFNGSQFESKYEPVEPKRAKKLPRR